MQNMRIIFMGTPEFAVHSLQALLEGRLNVVAVYTQPPRPAHRGYKLQKSAVHLLAEKHGIEVLTPKSFKLKEDQTTFRILKPDIAVVAAYGLILPKEILEIPKQGCINIHASLLPRWRGAAPIHRAIEAGDNESGITIMQMDEGLDTGNMLLKESVPITAEMTSQKLHDELACLGGQLIVQALSHLRDIKPQSQPEECVTYAKKLVKEEAKIDWTLPAHVLERRIRAFNPWPGTWTLCDGHRLKIWRAEVHYASQNEKKVGCIIDDQLTVACGEETLRLLEVQPEGKSKMRAEAFLAGHKVAPGTILG